MQYNIIYIIYIQYIYIIYTQYKCKESENNASLKFIVPAIWEKPQNERDCTFCMDNAKKWGIFDKKSIIYNTVSWVIGPQKKKLVHIPVDAETSHSNTKKKKTILEYETDYFTSSSEDSNFQCETSDDEYTTYDTKTRYSERWSQKKWNKLFRDLGLPNDDAELLASALK